MSDEEIKLANGQVWEIEPDPRYIRCRITTTGKITTHYVMETWSFNKPDWAVTDDVHSYLKRNNARLLPPPTG